MKNKIGVFFLFVSMRVVVVTSNNQDTPFKTIEFHFVNIFFFLCVCHFYFSNITADALCTCNTSYTWNRKAKMYNFYKRFRTQFLLVRFIASIFFFDVVFYLSGVYCCVVVVFFSSFRFLFFHSSFISLAFSVYKITEQYGKVDFALKSICWYCIVFVRSIKIFSFRTYHVGKWKCLRHFYFTVFFASSSSSPFHLQLKW